MKALIKTEVKKRKRFILKNEKRLNLKSTPQIPPTHIHSSYSKDRPVEPGVELLSMTGQSYDIMTSSGW